MSSLCSPADLCDRLGLSLNESQLDVMDDFYHATGPVHAARTDDGYELSAVAMCALWRMMRSEGKEVVVISSSAEQTSAFLRSLMAVTTRADPALTSISRWINGHTLKVGASTLRYIPNSQKHSLRIIPSDALLVVLGAQSSKRAFVGALKTAEEHTGPRRIYLWK